MTSKITSTPCKLSEEAIIKYVKSRKKNPTIIEIRNHFAKHLGDDGARVVFGMVHGMEDRHVLGSSLRKYGRFDSEGNCVGNGLHGFERFYWVRS